MKMLTYFDIYIKYEHSEEYYSEPAENECILLENLMQYELFDITNQPSKALKHFRITKP